MRARLYVLTTVILIMIIWSVSSYAASPLNDAIQSLGSQIVENVNESENLNVAILGFVNLDGDNTTKLGKYLTEELSVYLVNNSTFKLLERDAIQPILDQLKFNQSGLVDQTSVEELGNMLGVNAIISGRFTDLGQSVKINAKLISTVTSEIIAIGSVEIKKDQTVNTLLADSNNIQQSYSNVLKPKYKSKLAAGTWAFFIPSAGHAYAGNWLRGLPFLGGEVLLSSLTYDDSSDYSYSYSDSDSSTSWATYALLALKVWEIYDATKQVDKYNKALDQKFGVSLLLDKESTGIELTWRF